MKTVGDIPENFVPDDVYFYPAVSYERRCGDCHGTDLREDRENGDLVCMGCGLVAQSHCIDDSAEWRTFEDREHDPSRVGKPTSGKEGDLATNIGGNKSTDTTLRTMHARSQKKTSSKIIHLRRVAIDGLNLNDNVALWAEQMLAVVQKNDNKIKGDNLRAHQAAALFLASKLEGTIRDIAVLANAFEVQHGKVHKAINHMLGLLVNQSYYDRIRPTTVEDFLRLRINNSLIIPDDEKWNVLKTCTQIVELINARKDELTEQFNCKRPGKICASLIFVACCAYHPHLCIKQKALLDEMELSLASMQDHIKLLDQILRKPQV